MRRETQDHRRPSMAGTIALSIFLTLVLLVPLIRFGIGWSILAKTRLLLPVLNAGIVALTDADQGWIAGVPDKKDLVQAMSPMKWELVLVAIGIFVLFFVIKGIQFHLFARFCGAPGRRGDHMRAYLYGQGLDRLLPFRFGDSAAAGALRGQGATAEQATTIVFMGRVFVVFEIVAFSVICLLDIPWSTFFRLLFWPVAMLGIAYLFSRRRRGEPRDGESAFAMARQLFQQLLKQPRALWRMAPLSLVVFGLEVVVAFVLAMAFTSNVIFLHTNSWLLMLAIVGGYIARFYAVTPGGLGQWEWGVTSVLYVGGVGPSASVVIALLVNGFRYVVGTVMFALAVLTGRGVPTNFRTAYAIYTGAIDLETLEGARAKSRRLQKSTSKR